MKSKKQNITTAQDFETFKKECERWIAFFGLYEYEIYYEHKDNKNSLASTCVSENVSDKCCLVSLSKNWKDLEINDLAVRKTAFHEICEILLWEIGDKLAIVGYNIERLLTHQLIRRLENSVFKELQQLHKST